MSSPLDWLYQAAATRMSDGPPRDTDSGPESTPPIDEELTESELRAMWGDR